MAKVKSVEHEIHGQYEKFDIKVNSKGMFFIDLPDHLRDVFEGKAYKTQVLSSDTLDDVEKQLSDSIHKYKNSKTVKDLFIKITYEACLEYAKTKDGDRLFPIHGNNHNIRSINNESSSLVFDFEVLMRVMRDKEVTWYETFVWKGKDDERISLITREKENIKTGDIIPMRRKSFFEPKYGLLPYSEKTLIQLTHIRDELRKISETLFNLIQLEPEELEQTILKTKLLI